MLSNNGLCLRACAVRVTIFSTVQPVSSLHVVTCSYSSRPFLCTLGMYNAIGTYVLPSEAVDIVMVLAESE